MDFHAKSLTIDLRQRISQAQCQYVDLFPKLLPFGNKRIIQEAEKICNRIYL